ncbi:MAG: trypsin-like peptidase domain-containing protein [Planctomycetota bacterium]
MRRLVVLLLLAAPAAAQEVDLADARARVREFEREIEEMVARVAPAVGAITNHAALFDPKTGKVSVRPRGLGSGLVVTRDGLMLTNVHVVQGAGYLTVALPDGHTYPADLYADTSRGQVKGDIALLKLRGRERFPYVDWRKGDPRKLEPGCFVFAMGNPFGYALDGTPVVTMGIVSGKGRAAAETGYLYVDAIQTDAEINPGNSGGPLFDRQGRFLGINGLMASRQGRSNSGVGFAIPVDQVRLFMKQLLKGEGRDVGYGFHGLRVQSTKDESGARVVHIETGSPADEAGLKREDVILRAKGKRIRNRTDFVNVVGRLPEKAVVAITYRRRRNVRTTKFKLVSYAAWKAATGKQQPDQPLPLAARGYLGAEFAQSRAGVHLTRIVPGAAADRAGLAKDDRIVRLDKQEIADTATLVIHLARLPAGTEVTVAYVRGGRTREVTLVLSNVAEAAGLER